MFGFIRQGFIALLIFNGSLAFKCMSLNNEPCTTRRTLVYLNSVELSYYRLINSLDQCNDICNVVDGLSTKICVPSKTNGVNVKVFNSIARINETKTLVKQIPCDCECKFNSTTCGSNQIWNNDKC